MEKVELGDNIIIHTEDEGDIKAVCTGVTTGNMVHYTRKENGYLTIGFVDGDYVEKGEANVRDN